MPHMNLISGHVSLGGCAYLGGTLEVLRNKSVYLVDTDTCDADIQGLPRWLGLDQPFEALPEKHVGDFPHHRDAISPRGSEKLRRYLVAEYALQDELRRIAGRSASA